MIHMLDILNRLCVLMNDMSVSEKERVWAWQLACGVKNDVERVLEDEMQCHRLNVWFRLSLGYAAWWKGKQYIAPCANSAALVSF